MSGVVMIKTTALLFLRRCTAYILDCLLASCVIGLFQGLLWLLTRGTLWNFLHTWLAFQGWIVLSVVFPTWLYFSLAEASPWQATLGKHLLGLRVTDGQQKRLSLSRACLRNFLKILPWPSPSLLFSPHLLQAWSR